MAPKIQLQTPDGVFELFAYNDNRELARCMRVTTCCIVVRCARFLAVSRTRTASSIASCCLRQILDQQYKGE